MLPDPRHRRTGGQLEVNESPALAFDAEEHGEGLASQSRHDEQISSPETAHLIPEERPPAQARRAVSSLCAVTADGASADDQARSFSSSLRIRSVPHTGSRQPCAMRARTSAGSRGGASEPPFPSAQIIGSGDNLERAAVPASRSADRGDAGEAGVWAAGRPGAGARQQVLEDEVVPAGESRPDRTERERNELEHRRGIASGPSPTRPTCALVHDFLHQPRQ